MPFDCTTDTPAIIPQPTATLCPHGVVGIFVGVFSKNKRESCLRQLVDSHVGLVARVLRNAGTAEADVEDDVQRVFITLANRLDDVKLGAEKSFLVQTALNMAAHARRTAARRREILTDRPPEAVDAVAGPEEAAHRRQLRHTLDQILAAMDANLRDVLMLYEFEEMTTAEIASILEIPSGTVASRLRRARAEFRERVSSMEGFSRTEVG